MVSKPGVKAGGATTIAISIDRASGRPEWRTSRAWLGGSAKSTVPGAGPATTSRHANFFSFGALYFESFSALNFLNSRGRCAKKEEKRGAEENGTRVNLTTATQA